MAEFGFNNILGEDEINLFIDDEEPPTGETVGKPEKEETSEGKEKNTGNNKTTEVNPEDLFEEVEEAKEEEKKPEEKPESVGSEETEQEGQEEGSTDDDGGGTSPNENFYSSIANAMAEDGIFPNLDEDVISGVVDAESLSDAIEQEINARLDEKQQRVSKALEQGVEPTDIRMYEGTLERLASIKEDDVKAEDEQGEQLRYQLITQDYLNKGFSREKADKMARRSIEAGNDVEDAKEALESNKEYFQEKYNQLLKDADERSKTEKAERKKEAEKLKDSIFKDKQLLGDIEVTADMRRKAYENISKPTYKDPETGTYMTALQKYEMKHKAEFLKNVGLIFTLTNGFKDFDSFVKGKVNKEVKKGLKDLEQKINTTKRDSNGGLRLVTNQREDPDSFIGRGFKLDI